MILLWCENEMKRYFFLLFFLMIQGCGMSSQNEIDKFNSRVSSLLGDSDSVEIAASELTGFSWDSLCFRRGDLLKLTFLSGGKELEFGFSYGEYFVDEAYVKGSLDGVCISGRDRIVIKRKYPGYSKTIEFLAANK